MNTEESQDVPVDVQVHDKDDIRGTPERLLLSPILPEINEGHSNIFNSNEFKGQLSDNENLKLEPNSNIARTMSNETREVFLEPTATLEDSEKNLLETSVVKKEFVSEGIDNDIPILTTPPQASDTHTETLLQTNVNIGNEEDSANSSYLEDHAAKSALDAYLDGIATPIAPIRVKSEFCLQKTPQSQASSRNDVSNKDFDAMSTEFVRPPSPPTFSSNSNSTIVADGIATPRISLVAINRLRVKSEYSTLSAINQEESFDDLSVKTEDREAGEVSPSNSDDDDEDEDEPIPHDFFDDLLYDKMKARIEEAQNNDLEEKYSDRLKELERLKKLKRAEEKREKHKNRKKQKRSKKKTRKRSRSRSLSPSTKTKEKNLTDLSRLENHNRNKRFRMFTSDEEMASSSNYIHRETMEENRLRIDPGLKIKLETPKNVAKESSTFTENAIEVEEFLTPKQRREKAIKRAAALLNYLKESSDDNTTVFSTFPFVSTVRKLPVSHSYVQQQFYENRSPLHTVNNVSYKFNSHITRFNMKDWGLVALPPHAAKIAKLVGCDAQFIHNKLQTIKIPAKLKKTQQELNKDAESEEEDELIKTSSSIYSNVMTQTDDSGENHMQSRTKGYEIGVQVEPSVYSIGCQTLETQSQIGGLLKDDEPPIMKIIHNLNENQLMAIHAFAELITEPNVNDNAMEIYKIQMKILDIYKMSQIPSALVASVPPIINNYTTMTMSRGQSHLSVQSVKGADSTRFSVNDPRAKRIVNNNSGSSVNYDSRQSNFSESFNGRFSSNETYSHSSHNRSSGNLGRQYFNNSNYKPTLGSRQHSAQINQASSTTIKHYGRGALRR